MDNKNIVINFHSSYQLEMNKQILNIAVRDNIIIR